MRSCEFPPFTALDAPAGGLLNGWRERRKNQKIRDLNRINNYFTNRLAPWVSAGFKGMGTVPAPLRTAAYGDGPNRRIHSTRELVALRGAKKSRTCGPAR